MNKKPADPLLGWRKHFPILSTSTYLISNSLGAMPREVRSDLRAYADAWARRGVRAWGEKWWGMQTSAADAVAPLIGAQAGELSVHTNVSLVQSQVLSSFRFTGKKREIVFSDLEFPSVMYVYGTLGRDRGARVIVERSGGSASAAQQKVYDAINEKTKLVPISHVFFRNSEIQDVAEIARKARRWGATVILDAYHSVGILPVDVRALGVDILVGGVLKWLCGGPGGAFLWVRPSLLKSMEPKVTGWAAHREPFAFETEMRLGGGAGRMLTGTPAVPALYAMQRGPRMIGAIGIEKIRAKSVRQTGLIAGTARELGFGVLSPPEPERRGGAVTLSVPHAYRVCRELLRRNIIVDYREGSGIRIAPHFYNSDREILFALDQMNEIIERGEWRRHSPRRVKVP